MTSVPPSLDGSATPSPTASPERSPLATVLALGAAVIGFAMSQTVVAPALPKLGKALDVTTATATWALTTNLVCAAVLGPIFGRLGDMFGKRRMLVVALGVFGVGAVIAALGPNLAFVLAGRAVMGAGGGIMPLSFGLVRDTVSPARRKTAIGTISTTTSIGGAVGLVVGGVLVDNFPVQSIFWIGAISAVVTGTLVMRFVPESAVRTPARIDLPGAALLAVGLSLTLVAISAGGERGWADPLVVAGFAGGCVILAGFVRFELGRDAPLVDVRLLMQRTVLLTNTTTLFLGVTLFNSLLIFPQIAQLPRSTGFGFGYSTLQTSALLLPSTAVAFSAGPISGWISHRWQSKVPLLVGATIATVGLVVAAGFHSTPLQMVGSYIFLNFGMALALAALPNLLVDTVPAGQMGEAAGMNVLIRNIGGAVGTQVVAAILVVHSRAGGSAYPSDGAFTAALLVGAGAAAVAAVLAPNIRSARHRKVGPEEPVATAGGPVAGTLLAAD